MFDYMYVHIFILILVFFTWTKVLAQVLFSVPQLKLCYFPRQHFSFVFSLSFSTNTLYFSAMFQLTTKMIKKF